MRNNEANRWIVKVSANDSIPLIYFPKKLRDSFGIRKGDYLAIFVDTADERLILKKIEIPVNKQLKEKWRK